MPATAEGKARKLSKAIIATLQVLADAEGHAVYGIHKSTAAVLLRMGFAVLDKPNQHPSYEPGYWITPHGRRALAIMQRGK